MTTPILLDAGGNALTPLEDFVEFKEEMRWFQASTFELTLDIDALGASDIQRGQYIWPRGGDEVYLIEQVLDESAEDNPDRLIRKVWGVIAGMLGERLVLPSVGAAYDAQTGPAETLLKHYVDVNAGPNAVSSRRVPNFVIEVDAARGAEFSISGRYNVLVDLLSNLSITSGLGWSTHYDPDTKGFVFSVLEGTNRGDSVVFSREFANLTAQELIQTDVGHKSYAFIGGQGEGAERTITEAYLDALEPEGLSRREFFVDARDIDPEQEASGALITRGTEKLREAQPEDSLEITVDPYTNFRFNEDYFLGDIIGLRDDRLGYAKELRLVEVIRTTSGQGETLKLALDRPYPTLRDKTRAQTASLGSRAGDGAVIDYPTNSGFRYLTTIYYTTSGTFNKANYPGLRAVKVKCQGGGGGGGAPTTGRAGPGGGGGGYAEKFVLAGDLAPSETVTVGQGGAGGIGPSGHGGHGTPSSFGTHCLGARGLQGNVSTYRSSGSDSNGVGDLVFRGGYGGSGANYISTPGGNGGDSHLGGGGAGDRAFNPTSGFAGYEYGGGGGGGNDGTDGGSGAQGIVIVEVYV